MSATIRYIANGSERTADVGAALTIGRARDNDLPLLDDSAVSRHHACIALEGAGYVIEDLRSQNGTFVERGDASLKVTQAIELLSGDVIKIGQARIAFEISKDAANPTDFDPSVTQVPQDTIRRDWRPPEFRKEKSETGDGAQPQGLRRLLPFRRPKAPGS